MNRKSLKTNTCLETSLVGLPQRRMYLKDLIDCYFPNNINHNKPCYVYIFDTWAWGYNLSSTCVHNKVCIIYSIQCMYRWNIIKSSKKCFVIIFDNIKKLVYYLKIIYIIWIYDRAHYKLNNKNDKMLEEKVFDILNIHCTKLLLLKTNVQSFFKCNEWPHFYK